MPKPKPVSFSPFVYKPAVRTIPRDMLEQILGKHDITLPPSHSKRKEWPLMRGHINGDDSWLPKMSEDDLECAKRYPIFEMNAEEVAKLAEDNLIDTKGMSKIGICHALHKKGVQITKTPAMKTPGQPDVFMPAMKTQFQPENAGTRSRRCKRAKDGFMRNSKGRFCRKMKRGSSKRRNARTARK